MRRKRAKVGTYEELVTEIRKLIDEARAKGVPLFERDDLLRCRGCRESAPASGGALIMLRLKTPPFARGAKGSLRAVGNCLFPEVLLFFVP